MNRGAILYRSTDLGGSWDTLQLHPLSFISILHMFQPNNYIIAGGMGLIGSGFVTQSTDGGKKWTHLYGSESVQSEFYNRSLGYFQLWFDDGSITRINTVLYNPSTNSKMIFMDAMGQGALYDNGKYLLIGFWFSFNERIKAGKFAIRFPLINERNFPVRERRERRMNIYLLNFQKDIFFGDAVKLMEGKDVYHPKFRPTKTEEFLALAADYPDLQIKYPIISVGDFTKFKSEKSPSVIIGNPLSPENKKDFVSSLNDQFDYFSLFLTWEMKKRFLDVFRLMSYCPAKMRFAAVSIEEDKKWKTENNSFSSLKHSSVYDLFPNLKKIFKKPD